MAFIMLFSQNGHDIIIFLIDQHEAASKLTECKTLLFALKIRNEAKLIAAATYAS